MGDIIKPLEASSEGLVESVKDATSAEGMIFFHANEGKPLATPWQVALSRAILLNKYELPDGYILDCACGSGIQVAAYSAIIKKPVLGIELNPQRARASAVNFNNIFIQRGEKKIDNLTKSIFIAGDGRDGNSAIEKLSSFTGNSDEKIALLHLDPARPRNSRSHSLDEMQPRLGEVFAGWKQHLGSTDKGPAILLDLSPRLSHQQKLEVEEIVDQYWPSIAKTWTWTSRGKGRVDRLALWLGSIAEPNNDRRFIRISPDLKQEPFIFQGGKPLAAGPELPISTKRMPKRGEYVTILDSAFVECGLAQYWLENIGITDLHWIKSEGRRPQIHHPNKLNIDNHDYAKIIIQTSGRIVEIFHQELNLETVDEFVEQAVINDISKITIRSPLEPSLQPKIQGSFDRQLSRRSGKREGFLLQHPDSEMTLLCVIE
ncbi:MAG: hypothetical protein CBE08_001415 [Euryarchaeota archaeon TMED248]|nr:MAG: hypothetical protein CBE08_001415 [Euryarchaeota archaeon TMED248]